jgi:hypothetical protein
MQGLDTARMCVLIADTEARGIAGIVPGVARVRKYAESGLLEPSGCGPVLEGRIGIVGARTGSCLATWSCCAPDPSHAKAQYWQPAPRRAWARRTTCHNCGRFVELRW